MNREIQDIGRQILILSSLRGVSCKKMSDAVGLAPSFVSNVMKKKYLPFLDNLINIADFFGIPVEELIFKDFSKEHPTFHTPKRKWLPVDTQLRRLIFLKYKDMPENQRPTRDDVLEDIGISKGYLESKKRNMRTQLMPILVICEYFDISLEDFLYKRF